MGELTLLLLRLGFLVLLWAFVFSIVYSLRSDLFGTRARRLPDQKGAAAPAVDVAPRPIAAPPLSSPAAAPRSGSRIVITSGPKAGLELPLGKEALTIGRSSDSGLVIRDDYTSTHHARLVLRGDEWFVQDLDSTNGTFLAGNRVSAPTPVPVNTPITIGTTSFELRR